MTPNEAVTDPGLRSVLEVSKSSLEQALELVDQLAQDGETSSPELASDMARQQKFLIANLAQLRGLHRTAHFSARETKAQTAEARQEVDRLHLQLQNLYYEQRHLQGEIAACESYECVNYRPPPARESS